VSSCYIFPLILQKTLRLHTGFTKDNFHAICHKLARKDAALKAIIDQYGLPPMWTRPAIFQSLILFILEQQVSLASAYAAFKKLKEKIGFVTPKKILALTDAALKACYFSRQKIVYARALATAVVTKQINLKKLGSLTDEEIRTELKKIKGIGDWTVDVYLMHALQRTDLFPLGDIALVNSLKEVKQLHPKATREEMLAIAESWRPYRTIASMILWHAYIQKRGIKVYS
jgi:DNA-3-methyladenine glycosylase II